MCCILGNKGNNNIASIVLKWLSSTNFSSYKAKGHSFLSRKRRGIFFCSQSSQVAILYHRSSYKIKVTPFSADMVAISSLISPAPFVECSFWPSSSISFGLLIMLATLLFSGNNTQLVSQKILQQGLLWLPWAELLASVLKISEVTIAQCRRIVP